MDTVGLCGLGNMGGAIASRLSRHYSVLGFDPDGSRAAAAEREYGVTPAGSAAAVGDADIVVLCLPTPRVSLAVAGELATRMRRGGVVVETSTVNPADIARTAEVLAGAGIGLVDAAILSGVSQMAAGSATLLVGGDTADIDRVRPVLEAFSRTVRPFGPLGSGMAAKVINNAVAHAVMVVLAEAGALAAATGVPRKQLVDLLSGPEAGLTRPLTHRFAERVLHTGYDGGMPTEAARKDSTLALDLAQDNGVPLFAVQAAHTVYELGIAEGLARQDYASIASLWERWTGRGLADVD
jgi:3-hydroxyisobutyrate dehydrogenase-like beta-hydroxyacid dehydrogenase